LYHIHFFIFNSRTSYRNAQFPCNCSVLICFRCAGRRKCGIKTRCSVCFYRRIKDYISFISTWHLFVFHIVSFYLLGNSGIKLKWLQRFILQGTGSAGATVRVYIEQFEPDASKHDVDAQIALKPLIGYFIY